jgi:hypothetical protein
MRAPALTGLLGGVLLSVAGAAPARTPPSLRLRLTCDETRAAPGKPLECDVLLENRRGGAAAIVPRLLLPFALGFRPATVIEFEATRAGRTVKLAVAPAAGRGRYDVGTLSALDLLQLSAGTLYGWRYDLNGDDWLLPAIPGTYEIRARVRVGLLHRRKDGSLEPAVASALGRHQAEARSLVMDGEWISSPVTVTIQPPK